MLFSIIRQFKFGNGYLIEVLAIQASQYPKMWLARKILLDTTALEFPSLKGLTNELLFIPMRYIEKFFYRVFANKTIKVFFFASHF